MEKFRILHLGQKNTMHCCKLETDLLCRFTQGIGQCRANGGVCQFRRCRPGFYRIGRCFPGTPCCRRGVSSGVHKPDIAV
uniref:Beta-defensin-like domain-containing protein n=1 Tax=Pelusios castaneus TaxID=367368 RepID=A0A8C8RVM8_9SAUR